MAAQRSPTSRAVGIDVGGTKVLGGVVDIPAGGDPTLVSSRRVDVRGDRVLEVVRSVAADLARDAGDARAVGLALAGFVGFDGVVVASPNVPALTGRDLAPEVAAATLLPVVVDNDANCVARAAHRLRRPHVEDLVAVTLGTGIGGGVVCGGRLRRGAHGFAGEPGHMVVDPTGPACPCGRRGCWERYASGAGLAMLAGRAALDGRAPELAGSTALRGEDVVAAARDGGRGAAAVLEEFGGWVALGVANLVNLLDPEVVVLGGGLADEVDVFLPAVRRALELDPTVAGREVAVEAAPGGSTAGVVGAALAAIGAQRWD